MIIPALNESATVAAVVASVPTSISGQATETIVMDDGSTDETAERAKAAGALVCRFSSNLGQGTAFRVGYALARTRGASFLATLDADGQFDGNELASVVAPLISGSADFVNGSRRLGRAETTDAVRKAGVVAYGVLVSILTRQRITDPANGLRAFRADVTDRVPLRQPQYQTAELLIGAVANGYRVIEVPVTVRARVAGQSKKGGNIFYGLRFGQVVFTTWWAERRSGRRR